MASPSQEEVFKTIEEQLREYKIVTFKWLSRKLKLHNTFAKQYLNEWVEKNPQDEYLISYTVFGKKENGELLVMLTQETAEDYFKSKNVSVIKKYVYSIQLSDTNFEPALIYNIDKSTYESRLMSLSSINYHKEIISERPKVAGTSVVVNGTNKRHDNFEQNDLCKTSPPEKNGKLKESCVDSEIPNSSKTLPKGNDSKIASKIVSTTEVDKKPNSTKKPKLGKSVVANGSIKNFFGKSSTTRVTGDELEEAKANSVTQVVKIDSTEDTEKTLDKEVGEECATHVHEKTKKKKKSTEKNSTRKTKRKSKQMKRIIMSLDSESDGESNDSDASLNLDEIVEPEPNVIDFSEPELEVPVLETGRKKRKRTVEESEMDDEGFMRTTKKVVYESCDDEDESEGVSDQQKPIQSGIIESGQSSEKKPKLEPPTKKKQSSILSFFHKPK